MNWRAEEDFLAQREDDRNARITRALTGSMKPPDEEIIKSLKEKKEECIWGRLLENAGTAARK